MCIVLVKLPFWLLLVGLPGNGLGNSYFAIATSLPKRVKNTNILMWLNNQTNSKGEYILFIDR